MVKELVKKIENEQDIIVKIVRKHILDTVVGNEEKEELDYVDIIYPALSVLFEPEVLYNSAEKKSILREYYENNYESNITYDDLLNYFVKAKDGIESTKDEKKKMEFVDYLKETMKNICLSKQETSPDKRNQTTSIASRQIYPAGRWTF